MIFPRSQLRTHTCLLSPGRSTGVHSSISRCPLGAVGGPQQRPALCSRGCRKRWQASRIAGVAVAASSRVTVFPAGKKQAKVALPACILLLTAADVVERRQELTQSIGDAIAAGATGVLLEDDDGTGAFAKGLRCCPMIYPYLNHISGSEDSAADRDACCTLCCDVHVAVVHRRCSAL